MKKLVILIIILSAIACQAPINHNNEVELIKKVRVKVLENSTITYCILNQQEQKFYKVGDTVWLNIEKHTIDDTTENTMKVVFEH